MYRVRNESVARGDYNGWAVPSAVDIVCPHCRRDVTFLVQVVNANQVRGLPITAACPRCKETVDVVRLGGGEPESMRVFVDADPVGREPVDGLALVPDSRFSKRLREAYESALRVYNIGEASPAFAASRVVLEGIVARLLDDGPQTQNGARSPTPLARRLRALSADTAKLAEPVIGLSDAIRAGGNLGAHFDEDAATTIDDARHMLDLLDLLITFVFVIPEQTKRFREEVLKELPDETSDPDRSETPPADALGSSPDGGGVGSSQVSATE